MHDASIALFTLNNDENKPIHLLSIMQIRNGTGRAKERGSMFSNKASNKRIPVATIDVCTLLVDTFRLTIQKVDLNSSSLRNVAPETLVITN